jgi:hypothetical protein
VRELQTRLRDMEGPVHRPLHAPVSTGCAAFDALWPAGGMERGTLVEWFPAPEAEQGSGCATLALVVVDRANVFYPPAALALGIAAASLVIVRPQTAADELWAIDQSLRSAAVAVVWAQLEKLGAHDFRRLQLAAEQSSAVGLLVRPARTRWQPSWAHVRVVCRPIAPRRLASGNAKDSRYCLLQSDPPTARRLNVEVIRVRGGTLGAAGRSVELEMDETTGELQPRALYATHSLPPFSALAAPAADGCPA